MYTENFAFKELHEEISGSTMIIVLRGWHILQPYQSARRISSAFRPSRVAHRVWGAESWAEKGLSLVSPLFQVRERALFHWRWKLRAQSRSTGKLSAPYQLFVTQMGKVMPSQQQSRPSGDNMCVKDTQPLVLGLWLEEQPKKQHPTTCPWTGTAWVSP